MDITKQKRIDSLLNASHNSDAEKEYLRKRILEIFQDSEEGKKVLGELDKEDEDASKEGKKGRRNSDPTSKSKGNNQQEIFFLSYSLSYGYPLLSAWMGDKLFIISQTIDIIVPSGSQT